MRAGMRPPPAAAVPVDLIQPDAPARPEPPAYQYRPLQGPNSLRLLRLEPSKGFKNATLRASLEEVKTINYAQFDRPSKKYEAVSYAWETQKRDRVLICKGAALRITPNCEDALRRLRKPFTPRMLWIDALCINQDDDAERAQQVSIMGSIYLDATQVVVWLGKGDIHSKTCFRFFRLAKGFVETGNSRHKGLQEISQRGGLPVAGSLKALLQRSWFNRTWVIQEVILNHNVVVLCGDQETDARTLFNTMRYFRTHHPDMHLPLTFFDNIEILRTALLHSFDFTPTSWGPSVPLHIALQCSRSTLTTDSRDKVYSLLGLCKRSKIKPDYTKSPEAVFIDAALCWFRETHDITFLRHTARTKESSSKLPSWVPDFGSAGPTPWCGQWGRFGSKKVSVFKTSRDRHHIQIQGRALDIVNFCSETIIPPHDAVEMRKAKTGSPLEQYPSLMTWMAWYEFAKISLPEYPEGVIKCAFWWTLYMSCSDMPAKTVESWHEDVKESISSGKLTSGLVSRANELTDEQKGGDTHTDTFSTMRANTAGCAFGITVGGYPCLMTGAAKAGDVIVALDGLDELFVLRKDGPQFRVVCRCFVNMHEEIYPTGKMNGLTLK